MKSKPVILQATYNMFCTSGVNDTSEFCDDGINRIHEEDQITFDLDCPGRDIISNFVVEWLKEFRELA